MATKNPPSKERAGKNAAAPAKPSYRVAKARLASRSVAGHFPAEQAQVFRVLTASEDKEVQQLLAEAINLPFERKGVPARIPVFAWRRTRQAGASGSHL